MVNWFATLLNFGIFNRSLFLSQIWIICETFCSSANKTEAGYGKYEFTAVLYPES